MAAKVPAGVTVIPISQDQPVARGVFGREGVVYDTFGGEAPDEIADKSGEVPVLDLKNVRALRGLHNVQNAAAATAVGLTLGLERDAIATGLASFGGLVHRMEDLGHDGPVLFINDSKATNSDSAEKALSSFENIFWIVGGRAKAGGIEPLAPLFDRVQKAYLIGEAAEDFEATLAGDVASSICGTLEAAFTEAVADAKASGAAEPVVLLAPACASFDQFASFEARGEAFRQLAMAQIAKSGALGDKAESQLNREGEP